MTVSLVLNLHRSRKGPQTFSIKLGPSKAAIALQNLFVLAYCSVNQNPSLSKSSYILTLRIHQCMLMHFTLKSCFVIRQNQTKLYKKTYLFHNMSKTVGPVRPWPDQFWQLSFLKSSSNELKSASYTFVSILIPVTIFLIYLTAVHNMGLATF